MPVGTHTSVGRRSFINRSVPFVVLIVAGSITAAAVVTIAARQQAATASAFRSDTIAVGRMIQVQIDTIASVTHAAAALIAASPEINYIEFRAFVSGLQLRERYPGLAAIGFAPRVEEGGLGAFVRSVSLDGVANLNVRPEGARPEYFPTVLLEPDATVRASAVGYDLASEPVLLEAMMRARDSDHDAMTPLLDEDPAAGRDHRQFVLFLPVYRRGMTIDSVDARRRALVGFVFSRLQPDAMFGDSLAAADARGLDISIYDATRTEAALLVSHGSRPRVADSGVALSVGGRRWLLVATARDATRSGIPPEAQRILFAGTLLSLLVFALMRMQMRAWQVAERHAAELRAADRAKDEFLAVLSHELRTPLNAMLGWISMLRNGSVREDRRAHALAVIDRNAHAQARLIDDLLEVSRILMGEMRLEKRPMSVVPAVSAVIDLLRPTADAKGVTLHGIAADHARDVLTISVDVGRFAQIITNLVTNSVKFTETGGHVWVTVDAVGQSAKISVRDTGIGIAPEFLPYVFDRFRQADTSPTRSYGGLGMGLAIVRDLVVLHGGQIEAYSEGANQGSTFVVTFPLVAAAPNRVESSEPALKNSAFAECTEENFGVNVGAEVG